MIHVEQGRLRALEQERFALVERGVQDQGGIGQVGGQPFPVFEVLGDDGIGVDATPVVDLGQYLVLLPQHKLELLAQDPRVEQVLHSDSGPGDLVGVGGPYAAPGGADAGAAQVALGHLVQGPVVGHDQVRAGGNEKPFAGDAAGGEAVDLRDQDFRVDHHAVADDRDDIWAEHAGRQQVQSVALVPDDDGVPGVVATLVPDDVVGAITEQVGGLALSLVSPLCPYQDDGGHKTSPFPRSRFQFGGRLT